MQKFGSSQVNRQQFCKIQHSALWWIQVRSRWPGPIPDLLAIQISTTPRSQKHLEHHHIMTEMGSHLTNKCCCSIAQLLSRPKVLCDLTATLFSKPRNVWNVQLFQSVITTHARREPTLQTDASVPSLFPSLGLDLNPMTLSLTESWIGPCVSQCDFRTRWVPEFFGNLSWNLRLKNCRDLSHQREIWLICSIWKFETFVRLK